jgi:hypothetical protein
MKLFYTTSHFTFSKNRFLFLLIIIGTLFNAANAQQITINPRSSLILNGSVSLIINNAAFQNNGTFSAGGSTVNFSGQNDTLVSYVSGNNASTFNNLSVSKSAYGITLKSKVIVTNVLAVNGGNLYTDSNLTLKSDANLTARVAPVALGSNIIGKANVERYIPARRAWRMLTAPVTSSNTIYNTWQNSGIYTPGLGLLVTGPAPTGAAGNGLDASARNNLSMKVWNYSTQTFSGITNTKVAISAGNNGSADNTGYFIFVRGDRDPANTGLSFLNTTTINSIGTLQTGTQTFPASSVSGKYTLIGNPYASPIDFNNVTRTNLIKRFYVWDPTLNSTGAYVMMDDLTNSGSFIKTVGGASTGSAVTKDIQSSQAFFVQTIADGAASITFNESSKSGNNNNLVFRAATGNRPAGIPSGLLRTSLYLLNADNSTTLADGTFAEFNNMFSSVVDLDDALKFGNANENLSIIRDNVSLTAERRPALGLNDTLYFKLATTTQRNYQFVFDVNDMQQPDMVGYLIDSYLGTSSLINLTGTTNVNFTINAAAASAATNRFKIVFKPAVFVLPVTFTAVKAYQKNKDIAVEWKVENELNMVKYDIEKSTDGTVFTHVTTINVTGNNNAYNTYSWLDVKAVQGNNFYRIKSYDLSGEVKYSSIVKVSIAAGTSGFSIYPNPVTTNVINLVMNNQPAGLYQVQLIDAIGRVIFIKSIQGNGGNSKQSLNTGAKLTPGIYQLEITGENNNHDTQKVIVE